MGSNKLIVGVNDLQSQFPDIAAEAYGWDPITVAKSSRKKLEWKCDKEHIYSSVVYSRTENGNKCPICAGQKVLAGFNDLQTKFPNIAKEAYGWDPKAVAPGTNKKLKWKCCLGHIYESSGANRINGTNCPICANKKVLAGFNDLKSKFPEVAMEAYGWDPSTVSPNSHKERKWKCKNGHIYQKKIAEQTQCITGCPVCNGREVFPGFNDLKSQFPDIAKEAYGWDPITVSARSEMKLDWKCNFGHIYNSQIYGRTSKGLKCPICSGQQLLTGFNDLQTKFPDIAKEAYGWDATSISAHSGQKKKWQCNLGHLYSSIVASRTTNGNGCPVCAGQQVLKGFNDLQTKFPDIAKEAYGWDPTLIMSGIASKNEWKCEFGHIWIATVNSRTSNGNGCPVCSETGFNPEKDAWFYLMQRPGEQQLGISNVLNDRLRTHERNGWSIVEHTPVPSKGQKVLDTEKAFKKWLKKEIGLMEGTTENWSTTKMEVQSLAELKVRSGIETDLF